MKRHSTWLCSSILAVALGYAAPALGRAKITIININGPGVGLNDPTPAAPIGGNTGTTIGQQRLIALQYAANLWGAALDSSVEIRIQASFVPLECTNTSGVVGSAGPLNMLHDFAGAEQSGTWYPAALANKRAGMDLFPPNLSLGQGSDDVRAYFNINVGQPGCMTNTPWYYGIDGRHPPATIDLVVTALHELSHGLGFFTQANGLTGALFNGLPDAFTSHLYDTTLKKSWPEMTDAERRFSAVNARRVIWTGAEVTAAVPHQLTVGSPSLTIEGPSSIAGDYSVGLATFGARLTLQGLRGTVVAARDAADAAGPLTSDACSPLLNPEEVADHIAFVDRGTCTFATKIRNAQNAGAIAVIIADNAPGNPPPMIGGMNTGDLTILSVRITQADGNTLRAQLAAGVSARIGLKPDQYAGADPSGRVLMYTPYPFESLSSIVHWERVAYPNLLLEPDINNDLTHNLDLTLPLLHDIGWFPDSDLDGVPNASDQCPNTDTSLGTVVIQGCDSGVSNVLFKTGCTMLDLVNQCTSGAGNHGGYVSCVSNLTNDLKKQGYISGAQKDSIQGCASQASIP
jgi:hypothetical protein